MNVVVLVGRLTKDPELRYTPNGKAFARFSLAIDRMYGRERKAKAEAEGKATADFINITAWNTTAEIIAQYGAKGNRIGVEGRIQVDSWNDEQGKRIYRTGVVANRIEFLESYGKNKSVPEGLSELEEGELPF